MLSQAMQDYLKAIYQLQESGENVPTSALAASLGVTAPSATGMMKKLADLKLVRHSRYQGVRLTKAGERAALKVLRRHRVLELFLVQILGYGWDRVHAEAEQLEHAISEELEERMFQALGRPARDPHGHPIPTKDGKLAEADLSLLWDAPVGVPAVITLVNDRDPEMLRYLAARDLVPGTAVTVAAKDPFNGPITVRTKTASHVLGSDLARQIRVQVDKKGAA